MRRKRRGLHEYCMKRGRKVQETKKEILLIYLLVYADFERWISRIHALLLLFSFSPVPLFTNTHNQPHSLPPFHPRSLRPEVPSSNLLALLPIPGRRHTRNIIVLSQHRQVLIELIDTLPMAFAHQILDVLLLPLLLPGNVPALRLG